MRGGGDDVVQLVELVLVSPSFELVNCHILCKHSKLIDGIAFFHVLPHLYEFNRHKVNKKIFKIVNDISIKSVMGHIINSVIEAGLTTCEDFP